MPERCAVPEDAQMLYAIDGAAWFLLPDGRVLCVREDHPPEIVAYGCEHTT